MKKSILSLSALVVSAVLFSGCAGNSEPVNLYQPVKEEITLNNNQLGQVYNGTVILNNGSKIYDQEGDILASFDINNELFYILKIQDKNLYKIKNSSQKVIQEFKANALNWFKDDNKFVLCVSLNGNQSFGIYDNVYEFNGKEFNIINKNLNLSGGVYNHNGTILYKTVSKSGMYYIESWFTERNWLEEQAVTNILTGKTISLKEIKTNYKPFGSPIVIGIRNDIVYYSYNTGLFGSNNDFIEAYNINTKQTYTLATDNLFNSNQSMKKIQLLKSGNQVVLKMFDNSSLSAEFIKPGQTKNFETKYKNEPAKIISLNTLKEVKNISNDFELMPLFGSYQNIAGSNVDATKITYGAGDINSLYIDTKKNKNVAPLF